jgi:hypothetical protein
MRCVDQRRGFTPNRRLRGVEDAPRLFQSVFEVKIFCSGKRNRNLASSELPRVQDNPVARLGS